MHIMMKMIPRYYHSIITQRSIKYPNIKSQTNNILSRYFDKLQYCTLVYSPQIFSVTAAVVAPAVVICLNSLLSRPKFVLSAEAEG